MTQNNPISESVFRFYNCWQSNNNECFCDIRIRVSKPQDVGLYKYIHFFEIFGDTPPTREQIQ